MFDLRVQHRDAKTGSVRRQDPYRLHVVDGKSYYERPKGSGNLYWADGGAAAQIFWENDGKKKVIKELGEYKDKEGKTYEVEHTQYERPLTVNEKMQREYDARGQKVEDQATRIMELEAAAILAEAGAAEIAAEAKAKIMAEATLPPVVPALKVEKSAAAAKGK